MAIDIINGANMVCPSSILTTDYLRCDITFTSGTNLQASINFGDGSTYVYNLIGIYLFLF